MYINYNPNPCGKSVGDCVIRALTIALGESWDLVYLGLTIQGYMQCNWGSANEVWGAYLKSRGYEKHLIQEECSVKDFAAAHQNGIYVLGTGDHVVATVDGNYCDAWDSGREIVLYYFYKP